MSVLLLPTMCEVDGILGLSLEYGFPSVPQHSVPTLLEMRAPQGQASFRGRSAQAAFSSSMAWLQPQVQGHSQAMPCIVCGLCAAFLLFLMGRRPALVTRLSLDVRVDPAHVRRPLR